MNISRTVFNQYIAESDFRTLFVREMMWNNPQGQTTFDITVEETVYTFEQIAQRSGFQILTCAVEEIPTSSQSKKIDTRLRRQANDYICIYYLPGTQHHLWVAPVNKVEKRDLILVEYENAASASFLYEKLDGLSFDLDDHTTIMDVKERVQGAFIINSEKITKDFYTGFRKEHTRFASFVTGIDDDVELKQNQNKQWYTSVMLNRLMFCYFVQKKGFLNLNENYLREKLAWVKREKGENRFYDSFYKGFLRSLFHDGLNSPRHERDFEQKYGRIPYLNGGMFDEHELEKKYPGIDIADEAFESLFAFFDNWHWHLDDRLTATGRDINPDVLGYIFEQYINDRAQMGAYYTKEDITEYIGRNTIVPFLLDAAGKKSPNAFKPEGSLWSYLRNSGDRYIYDAVKHGHETPIPDYVAVGINTTQPNLLERRSRWNERTPEPWALPTEIWRETVERLQRYENIRAKIVNGEIHEVNDFITYNLNIRQFVYDYLQDTDDHLFVKHFYAALQHITILDPTCGSGAFLFAALNILEPLYEICISRMQDWNAGNPKLFETELRELNVKYRSNIRYFIYKSIILRNLYGVDIMVEATEIAKLRLFLKMVAVVDVNPRDPNLGLDPLPDIDFNIRCGNTLVGYATETEMKQGIIFEDLFAREEFETKVYDEIDVVSSAYNTFRKVQLEQDEDLETFKRAKGQLKERLVKLNELLNRNLHTATAPGMDYDKWKKSHQPFHWLAEFYDIIYGNGGFDVIIGNPPYVEYSKVKNIYSINRYRTEECGNLYAFVIERCFLICQSRAIGMIIPTSSICTTRMLPLQNILKQQQLFHSTYGFRPAKLFDGGTSANIHLSIFISNILGNNIQGLYHIKWNALFRDNLFSTLPPYSSDSKKLVEIYDKILRLKSDKELTIWDKICTKRKISSFVVPSNNKVYYRTTGGLHYRAFSTFPTYSRKESDFSFSNKDNAAVIFSILCSNLWNMFYYSVSNCLDVAKYDILNFPIGLDVIEPENLSELLSLAEKLKKDIKKNAEVIVRHYEVTGDVECYQFNMRKSKPIIDEIDKVLAKHYGFTEEELDFIINYDIKYRMGDELGEQ